MRISKTEGAGMLEASGKLFTEVFTHGTLSVEVYKPGKMDLQQPHDRDEIYVVISGEGIFYCDGERTPFGPGDFLFVPAFVVHRFEDYTPDFTTWVFFYGPQGGEAALEKK